MDSNMKELFIDFLKNITVARAALVRMPIWSCGNTLTCYQIMKQIF